MIAARTPECCLEGHKVIANKKWGTEYKPQGVCQDFVPEYVEAGGPGVTYTPSNKNERIARIIAPEFVSVQAVVVPIRRLEEFVVACKGAVKYRLKVDAMVTNSGWSPVKSSVETERAASLVPSECFGKAYMPKNKAWH